MYDINRSLEQKLSDTTFRPFRFSSNFFVGKLRRQYF